MLKIAKGSGKQDGFHSEDRIFSTKERQNILPLTLHTIVTQNLQLFTIPV